MDYRNCYIRFSPDGYNLFIESEALDETMILPLQYAIFRYRDVLFTMSNERRLVFVEDSRTGERYYPFGKEPQ